MNTKTHMRFRGAILFAFLCLASSRAAEAPAITSKPNAAPAQNAQFVSVFSDTRGFGKDPFFPKSTRRDLQPRRDTNTTWQTTGELPPGVVLKGLSGTKELPLAIINNYTFAVGEEAEVRAGLQLYRVKLIEIKERSVIISVNGSQPRELAFRKGL